MRHQTKQALIQDKSLYGELDKRQDEIKQAAQLSAAEHNPHHPDQLAQVPCQ